MPDLFTELLETVVSYDDGISASQMVCIPALSYLHKMADAVTIDRCIKKMRAERKAMSKAPPKEG